MTETHARAGLRSRSVMLACMLALTSGTSTVARGADRDTLRESFDLQVGFAPRPVEIDGAPHLSYELRLANFTRDSLQPTAIDVRDARDGRRLASFRGDALAPLLAMPPPARGGDPGDRAIASGTHALLYLDFALVTGTIPSRLEHRIEYRVAGTDATHVVEGAPVDVPDAAAIVLGPPLRGGPWAAIHHPSWPRGHRRVPYTIDGRARIPGRHAIDWVRLDDDGHSSAGDPDIASNAFGHGADVLAVADAVVAATRDDMRESATVSAHPRHALADASGNHVALDLGAGRFAFYEHLRPGSVRVARGDRVRRGQVIAALGFTGDSTGPHLHFHVADANSPLGAEGLPFVLDRFRELGRYEDIGALGKAKWAPALDAGSIERVHEHPAPNVVVEFPTP
jgi:murein DD-endopeptidase